MEVGKNKGREGSKEGKKEERKEQGYQTKVLLENAIFNRAHCSSKLRK